MLSIGDYLASRTGQDEAMAFRGTYDDEEGALAAVARSGGLAALVERYRLPHTFEPKRGDVVILDTGAGVQVGALCTGPYIAARLERGVIEIAMRLIKITHAWKVP
jgi:hypothetical protein